jgi:negative regulator of sigma E activity
MTRDTTTAHPNWDEQREQLSAYVDGELPAGERALVEEHVATCAECRAEVAALTQLRRVLRALPAPALPRSFTLPVAAEPLPAGGAGAPARSAIVRPVRVARVARTVQWAGGLAAMIGVMLVLGTALLGGGQREFSTASYGGAANAPMMPVTSSPHEMDRSTTAAGAPAGSASSTVASGGAASTPPRSTTQTPLPPQTPGAQPLGLPAGELAGMGLALGGAVVFVASSVASRRQRPA